jgi:hypothetical protein
LCVSRPYLVAYSGLPVPEFIDPVFTKTSQKRSFSLYRKRAFWLVFAKTGSIISATGDLTQNTFPVTPPENENIGRGTRAPSESGFKAGKNLLLTQSAAGEILRKEKNIFLK